MPLKRIYSSLQVGEEVRETPFSSFFRASFGFIVEKPPIVYQNRLGTRAKTVRFFLKMRFVCENPAQGLNIAVNYW
jgi:hypothetical protein